MTSRVRGPTKQVPLAGRRPETVLPSHQRVQRPASAVPQVFRAAPSIPNSGVKPRQAPMELVLDSRRPGAERNGPRRSSGEAGCGGAGGPL